MIDEMPYFCICSEEWCWCANTVARMEEACPECADGRHVPTPNGPREPAPAA